MKTSPIAVYLLFIILIVSGLPLSAHADGDCSADHDKSKAFPLKLAAIFSILVAGGIGVCLPILGKSLPAVSPEKKLFFAVKAFAAGVILATGFIHILPDSFDNLSSPCLAQDPWQKFPFAGFGAMMASIGTLLVDTLATSYYSRRSRSEVMVDEVKVSDEGAAVGAMEAGELQVHAHTHATHGHSHGPTFAAGGSSELIRHRVISQVLELGIVVHSVIIGISLGASGSPSTIRPLLAALTFHQLFEGMGLGGCITQAKFKASSMMTMILFFSLTTPVGIAIGIGISSVYNENSPTALIVEGLLNSAAAGILIYMALVDLLAADFMNPTVQKNVKLQTVISIFLLLGAGLMSLLAKWA